MPAASDSKDGETAATTATGDSSLPPGSKDGEPVAPVAAAAVDPAVSSGGGVDPRVASVKDGEAISPPATAIGDPAGSAAAAVDTGSSGGGVTSRSTASVIRSVLSAEAPEFHPRSGPPQTASHSHPHLRYISSPPFFGPDGAYAPHGQIVSPLPVTPPHFHHPHHAPHGQQVSPLPVTPPHFHHPHQPPHGQQVSPLPVTPQKIHHPPHQGSFTPTPGSSGSGGSRNRPPRTPGSSSSDGSGHRPPRDAAARASGSSGGSGPRRLPQEGAAPPFYPHAERAIRDCNNLPLHRYYYRQSTSSASNVGVPLEGLGLQKPKASRVMSYALSGTQGRIDDRKKKFISFLNMGDPQQYVDRITTAHQQLELDFQDILEKDPSLAILLCEHQGNTAFWVEQATKEFLKDIKIPVDDLTVSFTNMPTRLEKAISVLKECSQSIPVCGGRKCVNVATVHGRCSMDDILSGALDLLNAGNTWGGNISPEDLMFADYGDGAKRLLIAMAPVLRRGAGVNSKLDDLWAIWRAAQPFYVTSGELPLYFTPLQEDLYKAKGLDMHFQDYIRYHPALYAPTPRRNLSVGLPLTAKVPHRELMFGSALDRAPYPFRWQRSWKNDEVLDMIFDFENKQEEEEGGEEKGDGEMKGKDPEKDSGKYRNSLLSFLIFRRNGLQHPEHAGLPEMVDVDEVELYLSACYQDLLPFAIRELLITGEMYERFMADWSTYKASKGAGRNDPAAP